MITTQITLAAESATKFQKLIGNIKNNWGFLLGFLGVIVGLFVLAYVFEKLIQAHDGRKGEKILTTRAIAATGIFGAIAAVIMLLEIPLFFAPGFYKLDFSELPILVGSFAFGPAVGVMMEFVKILLKILIKGTSTAFVGELANFAVGCSLILPASMIYAFKKTKKNAIVACVAGTIILTVFGTAFNAVYLLPAFAKLFYGGIENLGKILAAGATVNKLVNPDSIVSFVVACVAPLNLIKGFTVSLITLLIYKPLSPIIKGTHNR